MFFPDLEQQANNSSIYDCKSLLNMHIVVESPKPKWIEVQFKRCQQFGYTHASCTLLHARVKCREDHDNCDCAKTPEDKRKCINCFREHLANYRGCQEYKKHIEIPSQRNHCSYCQNSFSATLSTLTSNVM